mmetsp:Transcript_81805/g.249949  ORF Transcript_81805/g.249949 Transcript_81805/m.249949 type:complete len:205 (-) Transcript_81805:104-718(-)
MAADWNTVGDKIRSGISSSLMRFFTESGTGEQSRKKAKASDEKDSPEVESPKRTAPQSMPFTDGQAAWLEKALGTTMANSFSTFGEFVDKRATKAETRAEAAAVAAETALTAAAGATKKAEDLEKEVAELRAKLAEASVFAPTPAPTPPQNSPRTSEASASESQSGSKRAYIGNLGWDTGREELERRFKELRTAAGIPEWSFSK